MSEFFKDYRDKSGVGYVIKALPDGQYTWAWLEPGEPEFMPDTDWWSPVPALRDAADDWEACGSAAVPTARILRAAATKLEKSMVVSDVG